MKEKNKFLFAIVIFLFSFFIFFLVYFLNSHLILEKREFLTELKVGDSVGFDLNNSVLTFGTIPPGLFSNRSIILENDYGFPVYFEFSAKGNIKDFLIFEKVILLGDGEKRSVDILAKVPGDSKEGAYSGKIIIILKKGI